tara:strand:- start:169 stop:564 length:396 start_codon:yes stop_codon:yes gene_type:complete
LGVVGYGGSISPCTTSQQESILVGKATCIEFVVVEVMNDRHAGTSVNLHEILRRIERSTIIILYGQARTNGFSQSLKVLTEGVESRRFVSIRSTNVDVEFGIMRTWQTQKVKEFSMNLQVTNGIGSHTLIG